LKEKKGGVNLEKLDEIILKVKSGVEERTGAKCSRGGGNGLLVVKDRG